MNTLERRLKLEQEIEEHRQKLDMLFKKNDNKLYNPYTAHNIHSRIQAELDLLDNLESKLTNLIVASIDEY